MTRFLQQFYHTCFNYTSKSRDGALSEKESAEIQKKSMPGSGPTRVLTVAFERTLNTNIVAARVSISCLSTATASCVCGL